MIDRRSLAVLFVDDEPDILSSLKRFLRREPYGKLFAENGAQALDLLELHDVAVVVSDLRMPEMSGLELIGEVKNRSPKALRLILSGSQDFDQIINSINKGEVFRFVPKPVEPEEFRGILNDAIDYYCLKSEREEMFTEISQKNSELLKANEALHEMTEHLRQSEDKFRSMTDAAQDAVFMTNQDGRIIYRNSAAEHLFGFDRHEHHEQQFLDIISPECRALDFFSTQPISSDDMPNSLNGGVRQINGLKKSGGIVPLEISKGVVHIDSVQHTVLVARDVSVRVEAERSRERYEIMQREIESEIEKKLLQSPFVPTLQGATISRMMIPSGHLDGDFTDYIVYDPEHADLLIGDVMGHGIQSALIGVGLKSLFLKALAQTKYSEHGLPPLIEIVRGMHALCIKELVALGSFATLMFLRIDLVSGLCSIVDCGHPPVIHYHAATGSCTMMKGDSLPMGMVEKPEYTPVSFFFAPGDLLVLYSDGVTESSSPGNELYGEKQLVELIESNHHLDPDVLMGVMMDSLSSFSASRGFDDDVTCVIVRIDKLRGDQEGGDARG
ncbi:MAG: SpoIIE family protein phosphatase [Chlorobiaceae bacterium]|nr:SpoIIE family protein phosphatase [Chlorobiaceae bacterium]NTW74076.1 SpoIIE family protein phosphatase [Chlorobiaceae bacterium]